MNYRFAGKRNEQQATAVAAANNFELVAREFHKSKAIPKRFEGRF